jgi:hypothetical protein
MVEEGEKAARAGRHGRLEEEVGYGGKGGVYGGEQPGSSA